MHAFAQRSYTAPAASSVVIDINCGDCTAVYLKMIKISKYALFKWFKRNL